MSEGSGVYLGNLHRGGGRVGIAVAMKENGLGPCLGLEWARTLLGDLGKCRLLIQEAWVGPEIPHFYVHLDDANVAGPWPTL